MSCLHLTLARMLGPAVLLAVAVGAANPAAAAEAQDHQAATAALSDVRAAVGEIVAADSSYSTDRDTYRRASQRAINAIEGRTGRNYSAEAGSAGDAEGAIGHIDMLLNRSGEPVWAPTLRSAETNLRVAVGNLLSAGRARELMDYQIAVSRALLHLEVAQGRPDDTGALGGLEGALANTDLGVPGDAHVVDACASPGQAPEYGVRGGYVAWISEPASGGGHQLPQAISTREISVANNAVVLRTAAAPLVESACKSSSQGPAKVQQTANQAPAPAAGPQVQAGNSLPRLYTKAQAEAGQQIFASKCVSCHGENLQGKAAPAVAGTDFLKTAEQNDWTVGIIRYIVFTMMPMNGAKLSPEQYADAMAFLLASNCYPAGNTPFPTENKPELGKIKLAPVPDHPAGQNAQGVCPVQ